MKIYWNGSAQCYWFDTSAIFGGIDPYNNYHGICGLMHQTDKINAVNIRNAFLNAEYYLRPGSCTHMLPRKIFLEKQTTHKLADETVTIHFPAEEQYEFEMDLAYKPAGEAVDMLMTISPTKDIATFEIFFASYICQAFDETWVPLRNADDTEQWVKLNNRRIVNECFGVVRDEKMLETIQDGRYDDYKGRPPADIKIEACSFSKPILVARNAATGLAIIFLLDPGMTTYLLTQYHGWDTAHDFCFGTDLKKGHPFKARARMVYRPFDTVEQMFAEIADLWSDFA